MMSKKAVVRGGLTAALVLSASLFSLQAIGGTAYGTETDYYSDATYTEMVGNVIFDCSNRTTIDGVRTQYSRVVLRWRCW